MIGCSDPGRRDWKHNSKNIDLVRHMEGLRPYGITHTHATICCARQTVASFSVEFSFRQYYQHNSCVHRDMIP